MNAEFITSKDNKLLKEWRKLAKSAPYRRETGRFLCEGGVFLKEAISCGAPIKEILLAESAEINIALPDNVRLRYTTDAIFAGASQVQAPQGVMFECEMRETMPSPSKPAIIIDHLQDPGNVGTILRTADAFGIGIYLTPGSADVYAPKVVRSTMGAIFRVPFATMEGLEIIRHIRCAGVSIYAAVLSDTATPVDALDGTGTYAVIIGNEACGVSPELRRMCDGDVILPMSGRAESLNAATAAAIFMWEQQRGKHD